MEWPLARLVDTGGIVPDDEALIPAEIFRQARVALDEAQAIVMVVDGRTELASPDIDLARLLLKTGKPLFLAVNKIDTEALDAGAENFRRLGIKNLVAISAEHGHNIGDLLDEVFAVLTFPKQKKNPSKPLKSRRMRRKKTHPTAPMANSSSTRPASPSSDARTSANPRCSMR